MTWWKAIPGPKPVPVLGNAPDFLGKQPWDVCASLRSSYGGMAVVWLFWKPVLVLNDAELIEQVLVSRADQCYKGYPVAALSPVIKKNLFVANDPEWATLRAAHPFSVQGFDDWLPTQLPNLWTAFVDRLGKFAANEGATDALSAMQRASFDAINVFLMGAKLSDDVYRYFVSLGKMATFRMQNPLSSIPPVNPIFYAQQKRFYAAYEQRIAAVMNGETSDGDDLLRFVLRKDVGLSNARLTYYFANIPPGGVFTFAAALANTIWLLARHPQEESRLRTALQDLGCSNSVPSSAQLEQCTPLDQVLRESLRLIPPVPMFSRNVRKSHELELHHHVIPGDTLIMIVNQALHRCADRWTDPLKFRPARWSPEVIADNPLGGDYYFPFGRGLRTCVSQPLSEFYLKVAIAALYSRFRLTVKATDELRQRFFFGIAQPKGVSVQFHPS